MKKIVILICLLILIRPIVPVIGYAINYDYISSVLCTNKQKQELGCHGKCYLMKQLATEADAEKPVSHGKKNVLGEFEFTWIQNETQELAYLAPDFYKSNDTHHACLHPIGINPIVFKPPII